GDAEGRAVDREIDQLVSHSRHHHRLAPPRQVFLELTPELLDPRDDRRGARIAEYADRLAGHVLGEVEQELEVRRLPLSRAGPPGGSPAWLRTCPACARGRRRRASSCRCSCGSIGTSLCTTRPRSCEWGARPRGSRRC